MTLRKLIPGRHPKSGWLILAILFIIAAVLWIFATPTYIRFFLAGQKIEKPETVDIPSDGSIPGRKKGELAVVFFNVKYGDGILIQAPENTTSLIDGGEGQYPETPEAPVRNYGYELYVPFMDKIGLRSFRNFISTVPYSHHMGVQPDLLANNNIDVKNVYWTGYEARFSAHRRFRIHSRKKTNFSVLKQGDSLNFGPGVEAKVIYANKKIKLKPKMSRVIYLKYGQKRFLFMSDLPQKDEKQMALEWGESLRTDVMKVGTHGGDDSTSYELVKVARPDHAVISVSNKNPLGAPKKSVLKNLKRVNAKVHKTLKHGHIAIFTDGESLRVERRAFPFVSTS